MTIKKIIGAVALMGLMASANAASVSMVYTGGNDLDDDGAILAAGGDTLTFDLIIDFSDQATLGGGFDVNYDASGLGNVVYTSAGLGEDAFGRDPVAGDGLLFNGAVGAFNGLTTGTIASISFTVVGTIGDFAITPGGATDGMGGAGDSGPWIDFATFVDEINPDYNGATVRVIPVPAAVWFMLSGLGALVGFGRRKAA